VRNTKVQYLATVDAQRYIEGSESREKAEALGLQEGEQKKMRSSKNKSREQMIEAPQCGNTRAGSKG
jgi:hypothetical protein